MTEKRISPLFTWRSAIVEDPRLIASTRHVALTLSLYMSEKGDTAFPSVDTLAKDCARGKSTISAAIAQLEEYGWLEVSRAPGKRGGRGRTNLYRALVPKSIPSADDQVNGPETEPTSQDVGTVLVDDETVPTLEANGPESTRQPRHDHATTTPSGAPRQRDAVFDALALETGSNPSELTRPALRAIGVALADIRSAMPDVTAAEIERRADVYRTQHPTWDLTANALAKHWASSGSTVAAVRSLHDIDAEWERMRADDDAHIAAMLAEDAAS